MLWVLLLNGGPWNLSSRTPNLWQPAQVDRLHADKQHPGDDAVPAVRGDRHSAAARYCGHPVYRPRYRHRARRVLRLWRSWLRHHDSQATRSQTRSTSLPYVRISSSLHLVYTATWALLLVRTGVDVRGDKRATLLSTTTPLPKLQTVSGEKEATVF